MSTLWRCFIAVALATLLAGCDAKQNDEKRIQVTYDPTPDAGTLGFVNAIVDGPPVTIGYAGSNGGGNQFQLGFGQALRESLLVGGYNVRVAYPGTDGAEVILLERLGDDNIKLFTDDETTLVLAGTLANPTVFLIENQEYLYGVADPDNIAEAPQIQFAHAVAGPGALDFYITAPTAALADATPVRLAFGAASALQDVTAGASYRIRVTGAGNPADLRYDSGTTSFGLNTRTLLGAFNHFGSGGADLRVKAIRGLASSFAGEPYGSAYRVGNLIADVPGIDLYFGPTTGVPVLNGQPFKAISAYQAHGAGSIGANVTVAGSPADLLFSDTLPLSAGDAVSLFFAGLQADAGSVNVIGLSAIEDPRPIPGYAQVRAVHGAASSDPVSVYLLRPGQTTTGRTPTFSLLAFGDTRTATTGAGDYDLRVENSAGTALIGPERVTLTDTSMYTLLLSDTAGGGVPLEWLLVPSPIGI